MYLNRLNRNLHANTASDPGGVKVAAVQSADFPSIFVELVKIR